MESRRLIRRKKLDPSKILWLNAEGTEVYSPPPSGHPLYAAIGEISERWAFIEVLLDGCIATLADVGSEITACITAQMMGHVPRCLTIKALARWRGLPDIEKAAEKLQNKLFEASELRNRAIHDLLLIEQTEKAPFKDHRMSKRALIYGLLPFDEEEFSRALVLIDERRQDCVDLHKLIREQVYVYT
jgi:hypothetical protein